MLKFLYKHIGHLVAFVDDNLFVGGIEQVHYDFAPIAGIYHPTHSFEPQIERNTGFVPNEAHMAFRYLYGYSGMHLGLGVRQELHIIQGIKIHASVSRMPMSWQLGLLIQFFYLKNHFLIITFIFS